MGVTYKAIDNNLHKIVALKVVNGLLLDSERGRTRFEREARSAASLNHRNVAGVYHLGQDTQSFFYAMEFIDGETVEGLVKRAGPQPWRAALLIALQVTRALMAAYDRKLVHRDLKPANIMLVHEAGEDEAVVKVIDFGLAKSAIEDGTGQVLTHTTGFLGTPLYASPEQCDEIAPDIRSDIYSLGVTLWYLLTGGPPFVGSVGKVFSQHLHAPPPWDQLPDGLPLNVRTLLERMLAKNRADRPQTPADLRWEIDACLRPAEAMAAVNSAVAPAAELAAPPASNAVRPPVRAGTSLADHLWEAGGRLPVLLVVDLLGPLAEILDAARGVSLDFTPHGVRVVNTDGAADADGLFRARFVHAALTGGRAGWLTAAPSDGGEASARARPVRPPSSAAVFAALVYELIAGAPPNPDRTMRPIVGCNRDANDLLYRALANEFPHVATVTFAGVLRSYLRTSARPVAAVPVPVPERMPETPGAEDSPQPSSMAVLDIREAVPVVEPDSSANAEEAEAEAMALVVREEPPVIPPLHPLVPVAEETSSEKPTAALAQPPAERPAMVDIAVVSAGFASEAPTPAKDVLLPSQTLSDPEPADAEIPTLPPGDTPLAAAHVPPQRSRAGEPLAEMPAPGLTPLPHADLATPEEPVTSGVTAPESPVEPASSDARNAVRSKAKVSSDPWRFDGINPRWFWVFGALCVLAVALIWGFAKSRRPGTSTNAVQTRLDAKPTPTATPPIKPPASVPASSSAPTPAPMVATTPVPVIVPTPAPTPVPTNPPPSPSATPKVEPTPQASVQSSPPAASAFGSIQIASDPSGALVSQKGHPLGRTPLLLSHQPIGATMLRISAVGYESVDVEVEVIAGRTAKLTQTLGTTFSTQGSSPTSVPAPRVVSDRAKPKATPTATPATPRPKASNAAATPSATSQPADQSTRELQRKAIEKQHQRGHLSDADYQQALRGLGY